MNPFFKPGALIFAAPLLASSTLFAQGWLFQDGTLRGVQAVDVNTIVAIGDLGTAIQSTDGGTTWDFRSSGTASDLNEVAFIDLDIGVAVGADGAIIRTMNGGGLWTVQTSGTTNSLLGVAHSGDNAFTAVGALGTIL